MRSIPDRRRIAQALAILLAPVALSASAVSQNRAGWIAPAHNADWPGLVTGKDQSEMAASLDLGPQLERGRSAKWALDEHRKLDRALATLGPQRKGVVDAYVVSVAFDSDPVFGREGREAGKVLARRYDAVGRSITLAGTEGSGPSALPNGTPETLAIALARIAELMDRQEDVLVLYLTGHGAQFGITYHDADSGYGVLSPRRLASLLDELGIRNRVLILSACYSGVFVPALDTDTTALFTAAADDRTSFGCMAQNDWTFFGDALINHALRKPQSLAVAADEARAMIGQWEAEAQLVPSNPQRSIGSRVFTFLNPLEARMPKTASAPIGKPARTALASGG